MGSRRSSGKVSICEKITYNTRSKRSPFYFSMSLETRRRSLALERCYGKWSRELVIFLSSLLNVVEGFCESEDRKTCDLSRVKVKYDAEPFWVGFKLSFVLFLVFDHLIMKTCC